MSGQVIDAAAVAVGVGAGIAVVSYGIYRAFSGGSKDKDSSGDKEYS